MDELNNNILKWLNKNIEGYEIHDLEGNKKVIFIPARYWVQAMKYFKKYDVRWEYRANYTRVAIFITA
jgi:hypothetical protein